MTALVAIAASGEGAQLQAPAAGPCADAALVASLDRLVRLAGRLLGAPRAIALYDDRGASVQCAFGGDCELVLRFFAGRCAEGVGAAPAAGDGLAGAAGAWAQAPLLGAAGRVAGVVAVLDEAPRAWSADDLAHLVDLAAQVMAEIELRAELDRIERERRTTEPKLALLVESLRRREQQLAEAQQIAQLGSWEWDIVRDTITWSDELYRIYGIDPHELRATFEGFLARVHPDDRDLAQRTVGDAYRDRSAFSFEHRILRPDGVVRVLQGRGKLVTNDAGEPARMVGTSLDITERKEAQERERELAREQARRAEAERGRHLVEQKAEELARLAEELERSNRDLDQFAFIASHDLKAPLRGISSLASWLEEDLRFVLTDTAREYLDLLKSRVRRMEALIDGVLQFSRAGRVHAEPVRVDTARLVREVTDMLHPPLGVAVDIQGDMPVLDAERAPLERVLLNLVGNAVKHAAAPEGRVRVGATEVCGFYQFTVSDDGPGIAKEAHERIWGVFQTLPTQRGAEGTGVGLAVVKKLVEAQGGRAWVESEPGRGATFFFLWPMKPRPRRDTAAELLR